MVSLEVSYLEDEVLVKVPMDLTRWKLPVYIDNAAAQEDIKCWPHLRGVEALAPKEIIPSCNGGPYAM